MRTMTVGELKARFSEVLEAVRWRHDHRHLWA
jgi:antitoxin (DNA-binding transcriptional repressor) of toxin-antitoxin stability system